MSNWNFRNLPLLVAFDAIMSRGSLVGAAEAMNVTQSAVSKQLAQLRDWLEDDLFVRTSEGMQPTPRALDLREQVSDLLERAAQLSGAGGTSPEAFEGQFTLSATDELLQRVVPPLVDRLTAEAPKMRLVTLPLARDYSVRELESGRVNLVLSMNWRPPEHLRQRGLGSDPFVCLMGRDHPLAKGRLTLKRYAAAMHVLVAPLGHGQGVVDLELQKLGLSRTVCASVPSFSMITPELLRDARITTVPSSIGERLADRGPFVVKRPPLELPTSNYFAFWHPRFSADPRLRWVLDAVMDALGRR